jgi:GrpB-like predicted nucleotidyltransferase (UPF0157 family)
VARIAVGVWLVSGGTMKIEIVEYDPVWTDVFEKEKRLLVDALPSVILEVHHIGSTSVRGLAAKPIIDILLVVSSLSELDASSHMFEELGYECMGEFGIEGRRYFRKFPSKRTHHIHAFLKNDSNVLRHIVFRNYLESHVEVQKEYAKLKMHLVETCENNIERYCKGKDAFIKYHEKKALEMDTAAHNNRLHEDT